MSAYSDAILATTGLVGYWRLGESSGTTAADSSGNGLNGTNSGATVGIPGLLTGDTDTAYDFDGIDDTVSVNGMTGFSSSGFSLELWCRLPAADGSHHTIAGFRNNSDADLYIHRLLGGGVELRFRNSLGRAYTITASPGAGIAHIALVYDGSSLRSYINGDLASSTAASGAMPSRELVFYIGSNANNSFYFKGVIDEVALYNVGLSAPTVANHYEIGSSPPTTDATANLPVTTATASATSLAVSGGVVTTLTAAISTALANTIATTGGFDATINAAEATGFALSPSVTTGALVELGDSAAASANASSLTAIGGSVVAVVAATAAALAEEAVTSTASDTSLTAATSSLVSIPITATGASDTAVLLALATAMASPVAAGSPDGIASLNIATATATAETIAATGGAAASLIMATASVTAQFPSITTTVAVALSAATATATARAIGDARTTLDVVTGSALASAPVTEGSSGVQFTPAGATAATDVVIIRYSAPIQVLGCVDRNQLAPPMMLGRIQQLSPMTASRTMVGLPIAAGRSEEPLPVAAGRIKEEWSGCDE